MSGETNPEMKLAIEDHVIESLKEYNAAIHVLAQARAEFQSAKFKAEANLHLLVGANILVAEGNLDRVLVDHSDVGCLAVKPYEAGISHRISQQRVAVHGASLIRPNQDSEPMPYIFGTLNGGDRDGLEIRFWLNESHWELESDSTEK